MSLLLEALKKAAAEKQRQQARSEHPTTSATEEEAGGFTFMLDEPGADLGGAGPSGDRSTVEPPPSAPTLQDEMPGEPPEETLESLLADGQATTQPGPTAEPVETAPAAEAAAAAADNDGGFRLSLLDEEEVERELAAEVAEQAAPTADRSPQTERPQIEPEPPAEAFQLEDAETEADAAPDQPAAVAAADSAVEPLPGQAEPQAELTMAAEEVLSDRRADEPAVKEPSSEAAATDHAVAVDRPQPVPERMAQAPVTPDRVAKDKEQDMPDRVAPDRGAPGKDRSEQDRALPERPAKRQDGPGAVAPDRVLKAIERSKRRRTILLLALGWLTVLAAGGWGYLSYLEQSEDSSRIMARYRPPVPVTSSGPDPAAQLQNELQAALADEETVAALEAQLELLSNFVGEEAIASVRPLLDQRRDSADAAAADRSAAAAEAAPVTAPAEPPAAPPVEAPVKVTRRIVPAGGASTLEIQRRSEDSAVLRAYQAFQQGDLAQAGRLYQQVLKQQPRNRDAVIGLAAVAAAQRQYEKAADYYRLLLEYDPSDRQAFEGLIALPGQAYDPVELESKLKVFLSRFPDSARAQQALGQLMAGQQRWYEAQQAYFNAYTADKSNANYALNLAVSLDHLRKYPQALQYYRTALQLADERTPIDRAAIRKRIATLEKTDR